MKKGLLEQSVFDLLTHAGVPVETLVKEYDRLAVHYHKTGINKDAALGIWQNMAGQSASRITELIVEALCDASCDTAKANAAAEETKKEGKK